MGHESTQPAETKKYSEIPGIPRILINPTTFMEGNFAYTVLDYNRFKSMEGENFKPMLYFSDPMQIIRVEDDKEGFYNIAYDGHHRLRAAESYQKYLKQLQADGKPVPKKQLEYLEMLRENELPLPASDYDYDIYANDITNELIDKYPGQKHFTPAQAIREVMDPTNAHETIAAHRISALVLTEWRRIFGTSIDEEYSALAAFIFLGIDDLRDRPAKIRNQYLADVNVPLIVNQNDKKRQAVANGLGQFADIIAETRRGYDDITLYAFQTISSLDDTLESIALKRAQTDGLLSIPEVQRKIVSGGTADSLDERTAHVSQLFFQVLTKASGNHRENRAFREVLLGTDFTYEDFIEFLQEPQEDYRPNGADMRELANRHDRAKYKVNLRHALQQYASLNGGNRPSSEELAKIDVNCDTGRIESGTTVKNIVTKARNSRPEQTRRRPAPARNEKTQRTRTEDTPAPAQPIFELAVNSQGASTVAALETPNHLVTQADEYWWQVLKSELGAKETEIIDLRSKNHELTGTIDQMRSEREELKNNASWWTFVDGLTNVEKIIARVNAERLTEEYLRRSGLSKQRFDEILNDAVEKKKIYDSLHKA